MIEKAKVSPKQLIFLVVISRLVISITFFPALSGPPGNQDVWMSEILSLPVNLLLAAPLYLLWKRFPSQSLIEYCQTILGKTGTAIGFLYVLYFFHSLCLFLYHWSAFLTTAVMPETPVLFILVFLFPFCAYAVLKGIEVISRLAEFFAPIVFGGIIIIFLMLMKDMDLEVFTPFMEKGILSIVMGAFVIALRTSEILVLAMLLPYVNTKKANVKFVFVISFLFMALFWIITTVTVFATLGIDLTRILQFAYFSAVRLVNLGDFIERIESIHLSVWVLSGFLRIVVFYYVVLIGLSQVLRLKSYKPLVVSTLTILLPVSLSIQTNIADLNEFLLSIEPWINFFFIILIPSMLLLIAILRKQGETNT